MADDHGGSMSCRSLLSCPRDKYCEPSAFTCEPCKKVCSRAYRTPDICKTRCPEVWKQMNQVTPVLLTSVTPRTISGTTPAVQLKLQHLPLLVAVFTVFIALTLSVVMLYVLYLRKKSMKFKMTKRNQSIITEETEAPKNDQTYSQSEAASSRDTEMTYLSMSGNIVSQSTADDIGVSQTLIPFSIDSDYESITNDKYQDLMTMLGRQESYQPAGYSNRQRTAQNESTPCNNTVLVGSVSDARPSDQFFHAPVNDTYRNMSVSQSTGTCFDLRSDGNVSSVRNQPYIIQRTRHDVHPANDSTQPFRHVMRAYDQFDARLHELSFARGCLIANDEFQVFVSNSRDEEECYNRVMNIMPSTVPQHIINVEQESATG